jgi:tetratricopeptide (TPR) repeat protein/DNA-binding CsgD family transcriptional regulator
MTTSSTAPILCPVLIGRTLHLEALKRAIEQAQGGTGQTVLIAGEAGMGKSRLVAEAKTYVTPHSLRLLQGNCFESDRSLPYAPLLDLLRAFCANHSDTELSSAFGSGAAEILKLIPELTARLPELTPTPLLEPEAEKRRLFNALAQFFTNRGPLLIVIEDLHWSDDTSLEFLLRLARRIISLPILLLLTYRIDETHPALEHFLVELNRERLTLELTLQRLTMAELDEMLRAIFELDRPVSAAFQQKLYILTEGNPFFIEETLKALTASGSIFFERGRWDHKPVNELQIPRSVQDAVHRRSERLSEKARNVLELAAVAGRRFDFGLLQELTKKDEEELLPLVKEMVAAQLVIEETADQFAFRHALTREAVYLSLLIRERRKYHGLVADALERLYASSLDSRVGNLAYHAYEAGSWAKALEYSRLAGERAQALYAPQSALEQFTRALEAAQHMAVPSTALYRARGQAYETIGDFEKAQADFEQALGSAGEVQDKKSEWQALIDLGFLWAGRDYHRTGGFFQRAFDLARQMDDRASLAHSLNRVGNWHANVGNLDEALLFHRQALDVFEEVNDLRGLAETLDYLGMASQINGDLMQGTAYYQRAVKLFHELDDRRGLVSSLATLALCGPTYMHDPSVSPYSLAEATEKGEQALKIAGEISWRSGEIYSMFCLGISLGPQGEYQRALDLLQSALEISQEIEHDQWLIGAHCDLGALYLEMLELPLARLHLEKAFELAQEIGSSVWIGSVSGWLASACIIQKDLSRAETVLDGFISADTPARTQMERLCWSARAELALARGEPETALSIIDHLIASDPNVTPGIAIPRLWLLRGEALLTLKRLAEAESVLQAAQIAASGQIARGWLWRIHMALGKVYQMGSKRVEADAQYKTARSIVNELAVTMQDQALRDNFMEQALGMLPARQSVSTSKAAKDEFDGLTVREREVAALIARGESNREIAAALVISERTVESHVTHILTKLAFSSRARIAAWAAGKGLGKHSK